MIDKHPHEYIDCPECDEVADAGDIVTSERHNPDCPLKYNLNVFNSNPYDEGVDSDGTY